jgi:hypothetical protein
MDEMNARISRRAAVGGAAGLALLSACGTPQAMLTATPASKQEGWTPILPNSDLAVGRSRFLFAVLDERNRPILDANVRLRFFDRIDAATEPRSEADAPFRGQGLGAKGVYVARAELPTAGTWGVEALVKRADGTQKALRARFEVKAQSQTPAVGAAAVPTRQPLARDVADPRQICTAVPPCQLHDLTVADALALKRPALLLFATPGFCVSATCGPDLETVQSLEPEFRGRMSFLHLEIYSDPQTQTPSLAVNEWRLPSEPWVFLVDRDGKIADKLEGGLTAPELREGIERLV